MSSPILLMMDGILSQDEIRVAQALREISDHWIESLDYPDTPHTTARHTSTDLLRSPRALYALLQTLLEVSPELAGQVSTHDGSLPLHFAASLGDVQIAKLLLDRFPSAASTRNDKGKIPLMYAAREGRLEMVQFLLQQNPETAQIFSQKNKLALHFAAGDGHYHVCQLLLRTYPEGARVATQKGKVAMHLAARWGHLDVCRLLFSVYPEAVQALDWDGSLPLHDACRQGQVSTSLFLLEQYPAGVQVMNLRGEVPLFPAVRSGNSDLVELLIHAWPLGGRKVLRNVSEDDHVDEWSWETMELMLRGAVDKIEPRDRLLPSSASAVAAADPQDIHEEHDDVNDVVVGPGESPRVTSSVSTDDTDSSSRNSPMLHMKQRAKKRTNSALSESQMGFDRLEEHRPESSLTGRTLAVPQPHPVRFIPLHAAIQCGASLPVIKVVLEERPRDLQEIDDIGRTPLHWAVCHARIRYEHAMEEAAASSCTAVSPKKKKKAAKTTACEAIASSSTISDSHVELVQSVVSPAAARVRDCDNKLPLHLALEHQVSLAVVDCLLEAHPRSSVLSCGVPGEEERFKPVHLACRFDCDLSVVFRLLRADPSVLETCWREP